MAKSPNPSAALARILAMSVSLERQLDKLKDAEGDKRKSLRAALGQNKSLFNKTIGTIGNGGRGDTPQRQGASRGSQQRRSSRRKGARRAKARRRAA